VRLLGPAQAEPHAEGVLPDADEGIAVQQEADATIQPDSTSTFLHRVSRCRMRSTRASLKAIGDSEPAHRIHLAFPDTSSISSSPFIEIVLILLASKSTAFRSIMRMRLLS
jgi:hypothetical protein